MPPTQARDLELQRRENDVVMATFGNGFWILDDYSALREVSANALAEDVRLFPLRHVYQFQPWGVANAGAAGVEPWAATTPPGTRRTERCSPITCGKPCPKAPTSC